MFQIRERARRFTVVRDTNRLLHPLGCKVTGTGRYAVGVLGDARVYGLSVLIQCPKHMPVPEQGEIATLITNKVRDVTRVLIELS